jgi:hypothetical protein
MAVMISMSASGFESATYAERACDASAQCAEIHFGCNGGISVNQQSKAAVTMRYHEKYGNPQTMNCVAVSVKQVQGSCENRQCLLNEK